MKVEFKNSTNENFKCLEGIKGTLNLDLTFSFSFEPNENTTFDLRQGRMNSSFIKAYTSEEISRNCYEINITTYNSKYCFIYGEYDENTPPLTDEERLLLAMQLLF